MERRRAAIRIGLNLLFLTEGSAGTGRYVQELLAALVRLEPTNPLTAFVGAHAPPAFRGATWSADVEWVELPFDRGVPHVGVQLAALPALAARRHLDVLHSPANVGPVVSPGVARVVSVNDLIWLHEGERWESRRAARGMRVLVTAAARAAHRVITLSGASRDDLVANLGVDAAKIDVVPLGVRPPRVAPPPERDVRRRYDLGDRRVVLCVAQKRPYKNLRTLVRAVAELDDPGVVLVLPGTPTPHEAELRGLADELGVAEAVRFPAWVSEQELEGFYAVATCFLLPSSIEGFGLPVLEAMQRGLPVACSDRSALPEVVGNAALLFDPDDQAAVTDAVRRLLHERRLADRLVESGLARCRDFPWRRTAELTLASYERAVAARRRAPLTRLRGRLGRS